MYTVIIGGGEIGRALFHIIHKRSSRALMWDHDPSRSMSSLSLKDVVADADIIFICVPSYTFKETVSELTLHMKEDTLLVSLTKGIDPVTALFTQEIVSSEWKDSYMILSGPMLAEEILEGKPTQALLAGSSISFKQVAPLFLDTELKIYHYEDSFSVAVVGVLKNVYSLVCGIADGLTLGSNAYGVLMVQAFREMQDSIQVLKGNPGVLYTLAGLGDFLATSVSEYSNNRKVGKDIIEKGICSLDSEGCRSFEPLKRRIDIQNFPLLSALDRIINDKEDPRLVLKEYV